MQNVLTDQIELGHSKLNSCSELFIISQSEELCLSQGAGLPYVHREESELDYVDQRPAVEVHKLSQTATSCNGQAIEERSNH